jgi:protein TonB
VPTPTEPVARAPLPTPPKLKRGDEDAALKRFTQDIWRIVGKVVSERDYPRLARDRGWEGLTKVRVEIGSDGLLKKVTVTRSSGFPVLDDRAVAKMQEIKLPNIPDELRERAFSVDVPFRFSLRKGE